MRTGSSNPATSSEAALGVVFDIGALQEEVELRPQRVRLGEPSAPSRLAAGQYGALAWRIFMKLVRPSQITPSLLSEGDTNLTLNGFGNEFCIAVHGAGLNLEAVRQSVLEASDYGLAPFHRRLIETIAVGYQPLVTFGRIDEMSRLVTAAWNATDHELCKEAGWAYAPERVPPSLDRTVIAELNAMRTRLPV